MTQLWHRWLHWFCVRVFFDRLTVINAARLPTAGPVLYVGLHRNGAVDGFVYHQAVPRAVFMLAARLRKNIFGRIFFSGIEVVRTKDRAGDEAAAETNARALEECLKLLRAGGALFVFPEGTSSLGPRHLPYKSGAARLVLDYLESPGAPPLRVVPVGIHYESPWTFRDRVEVLVGEPVSVELPAGLSPVGRLREMRRRIEAGLDSVGINVASEQELELIQRAAYAATLGTERSYARTLKQLERGLPPRLAAEWQALEPELKQRRLWFHQGVPLFPMGQPVLYLVALLVFGALALPGTLLNLPPLLAGAWAGRRFPDGPNVIALWKMLVGVPVFVVWSCVSLIVCLAAGQPLWLAGYCAATMLSLKLWYRVRKLAVAVHNVIFHPGLHARTLAFRETVLREVPDDVG